MFDSLCFPDGVDVIVRLHDFGRLLEFDAALFSLFNQSFRPVHAIVVTQAFDVDSLAKTQKIIDAFDWTGRGHQLPSLINVEAPHGQDIRAQLLNVGIGLARNRFLAFLDSDDYLYTHAYEYLVEEALKSGAALTFGNIVCRHVRVFEKFIYSFKTESDIFRGDGLEDLLVGNFCPIHSFVVDRNQVSPQDLKFNPVLQRLEDYDFLLRLCSRYATHFESRKRAIGVYNWHLDGRGTTEFGEMDPAKLSEKKRVWNTARRHIWRLKMELRSGNLPTTERPDRDLAQPYPTDAPGNCPERDSSEIPVLFPIGHFYSPIANPSELRLREAQLWSHTDEVAGIDFNTSDQLRLLQDLKDSSSTIEYPIEDPGDGLTYFYQNDQFPALDACFLHAFLAHMRPRAMIEVGSGFSSLVTAKVNRDFMSNQLDFSCIEPYPRQFLIDGVDGISRVVREKVEDVDLTFFQRLGAGDILFIDSSHVSKVGSDVNHLFFEVLPRLNPGVLVHFHDIFLPDEYPKKWVLDQGRNWNEQYLLRAFLQFNTSFDVVWSAHFMGTRHTKAVQATFPQYPRLGGGGSFWIRKVRYSKPQVA